MKFEQLVFRFAGLAESLKNRCGAEESVANIATGMVRALLAIVLLGF